MVVAVASPSSAPGAAGRPHPTYKEMILQALKELPDPIRSSRRAIAKYISDNFSGLPSRHDALLTVHLRRLRSQGLLLMSGHSYLLSTSASAPTAARGRGRGRPPKKASASAAPQKRGPGRPRKNTALFPVPVLEAKPGPGRPRKNPLPVASSAAAAAAPLRLGVKLGPGRPRKNAVATPVAPPPASPLKRGVGRPRKNAAPMAPLGSSLVKTGLKRGPGRPRKNATPPVVSALPTAVLGVKRGRGRPPKNLPILSTTPGAKGTLGRPRKVPVSVAAMPSGKAQPGRPRKVVVTVAAKRKPGRPLKIATAGAVQGSSVNVVVNTSVSGARRGRGRPPKAKLPAHGGIASSSPPSLIAGKRKHDQTYRERRMPGRPRKDKPLQYQSVLSRNAALTNRGPGRPRKKRPLEAGGVVAAQAETGPTEDGGEAEHGQIVDEAVAVQNGGEVRCLLSDGASSMEKKGPGSHRKEMPLENEHTETGVSALVGKRGRGRPKKKKPSAAMPAETGDAKSVGIKRGRGRPRKDSSFQSVFAEAAGQVSRDVTEARPEGDADLLSGKKPGSAAVLLGESKETRPAGAGGVVVSKEKTSSDPVEAGSVMPCVNAGVDLMDSNLGTANP